MGLWNYLTQHAHDIQSWGWTTLWLAVVPIVVGLLIALPLGWLASRYRWSYALIVSVSGIFYTIPSLVAFLVLPSVIGTKILAPVNVAVALTLYTVALLTRTVADGLNSVAEDTLAAAAAMGYTTRQRLFRVQLPIAVPVIGAGLRVAAVSNVSLISVASIIGVTQLGQLFILGDANGQLAPLVLGLILFMVLALIFDLLILLVVRVLTPWQRAVSR